MQPQYSHLENGHNFMVILLYNSVEEKVNKMKLEKVGDIYTMEYYSAIKKNTFQSVLTDFLKRKLDRVYVILSLSGDTSLFASTPCIPSTFPFRRLCSPLPTPHSAYKSFPLRIT